MQNFEQPVYRRVVTPEVMEVMTVGDYIDYKGHNSVAAFAREVGVWPQKVHLWKSKGYVVVGGVLCKRMRDLEL